MNLYNLLTFLPTFIICIATCMTLYLAEKRLKSNREMDFSRPLYQNYLLSELPNALTEYEIGQYSKLSVETFSTKLKHFKKDIRYFQYAHNKIYQDVSNSIACIDRILSQEPGSKSIGKTSSEISDLLHKIYKAFLFDLPDDHIDSYFRLK
ncbi:hypothetical protein G6R29_05700 [Fructobacillus sp. M2-14]|uniref:Uncharacterized protein n=1 Tax=Fructobacillus broussonetiae TaxID=2713173 RepID=A0ABS5R100_9LACO|nr:hypothetical protein [Fructobacillus broussonetiae]MBS9339113.1 hypothetical protein [Fructobacillus broussonetiae]